MRRLLLVLALAALTATAAAAWLWPALTPPESVAESEADCTSCSLRHGRLNKAEDGATAD
jgi:hypothetical protein